MLHHAVLATADILWTIYNPCVTSTIDYAVQVLIKAEPAQIDRLEKVRNAAFRYIIGVPKLTKVITMEVEDEAVSTSTESNR